MMFQTNITDYKMYEAILEIKIKPQVYTCSHLFIKHYTLFWLFWILRGKTDFFIFFI